MRDAQVEIGLDQIATAHAQTLLKSDLSNYCHVQDLQFSAVTLNIMLQSLSRRCNSADLQDALRDAAASLGRLANRADTEIGRLTNR